MSDTVWRRLAFAWLVLLVSGCDREAARIERAFLEASTEWYVVAWGTEMDASTRAEASKRFACMWSALDSSGEEPAREMECHIRGMRAVMRCARGAPGAPPDLVDCMPAYARACASKAVERAARACPPARRH